MSLSLMKRASLKIIAASAFAGIALTVISMASALATQNPLNLADFAGEYPRSQWGVTRTNSGSGPMTMSKMHGRALYNPVARREDSDAKFEELTLSIEFDWNDDDGNTHREKRDEFRILKDEAGKLYFVSIDFSRDSMPMPLTAKRDGRLVALGRDGGWTLEHDKIEIAFFSPNRIEIRKYYRDCTVGFQHPLLRCSYVCLGRRFGKQPNTLYVFER